MKRKFYSLLIGGSLLAAGAVAAVNGGSATIDPGSAGNTLTPTAPTVMTATLNGTAVDLSAYAPATGYETDQTATVAFPAGTELSMTFYRSTNSDLSNGEVVYTKGVCSIGEFVEYTDNSEKSDGTYYYWAVAQNNANLKVGLPSEAVRVTIGEVEIPDNAKGTPDIVSDSYDPVTEMLTVNVEIPSVVTSGGVEYDVTGKSFEQLAIFRWEASRNDYHGFTSPFTGVTFGPMETLLVDNLEAGKVHPIEWKTTAGKSYCYKVGLYWKATGGRTDKYYYFCTAPVPEATLAQITDQSAIYDAAKKAIVVKFSVPDMGWWNETTAEGVVKHDVDLKAYPFNKVQVRVGKDDATPTTKIAYNEANANQLKGGESATAEYTDIEENAKYSVALYNMVGAGGTSTGSEYMEVTTSSDVEIKHLLPTGLVVEGNDDKTALNISWIAPEGDNVAIVSGYNVYVNDVKVNSELVTGVNYNYTIATAAEKYQVAVEVVYADGTVLKTDAVTYVFPTVTIPDDAWAYPTEPLGSYDPATHKGTFSFYCPNVVRTGSAMSPTSQVSYEVPEGGYFQSATVYGYEGTYSGSGVPNIDYSKKLTPVVLRNLLAGQRASAEFDLEEGKSYVFFVWLRWRESSGKYQSSEYVQIVAEAAGQETLHPAAEITNVSLNDAKTVATISWDAPAGDNVATISGYNVYIKNGSTSNKVNDALVTSTSFDYTLAATDWIFDTTVETVYEDGKTAMSESFNVEVCVPLTSWAKIETQSAVYEDGKVIYRATIPSQVIYGSEYLPDNQVIYDVTGQTFAYVELVRQTKNDDDSWSGFETVAKLENVAAGSEIEIIDSNVEPGKQYNYSARLRFAADYGKDKYADPLLVICPAEDIKIEHIAPTDVKAAFSEDNTRIIVNWTAPQLTHPETLSGYEVLIDGEKASSELITDTEFVYNIPATITNHTFSIEVAAVYTDNEKVSAEAVTLEYSYVQSLLRDDNDVEIYDLNGMRVKNPSNGLYIIRQNGNVNKVYIR